MAVGGDLTVSYSTTMTINPWLLLVLLCAFVYRVTRVITRDQFPLVMWPRERIVLFLFPEYADESSRTWYTNKYRHKLLKPHGGELGRSIAYLIVCDWCMSVWVAGFTVLGLWHWTPWFTHWVEAVMYGVTAAAVTGYVASKEED